MAAESVAVVIPYSGSDPLRERNLRHVVDFYCYEFPDWPVVIGADLEGGPFSRARAINRGVDLTDSTVVVINDADTLIRPEQLKDTVAWAAAFPGLVYGYIRYRRLTEQATSLLATYKEAFYGEIEWQQEHAPSQSVVAIRRDDFDEIGGLDESFVGWGYEDLEFAYRANEHSGMRRVPGDLFHLWHGERDPATDAPLTCDPVLVAANWARLGRILPA